MWHSLFLGGCFFWVWQKWRGFIRTIRQLLEEVWAILEETAWILEFKRI